MLACKALDVIFKENQQKNSHLITIKPHKQRRKIYIKFSIFGKCNEKST